MLFNDNREQWRDQDLWPGGGNAIARPAQAQYKSIGMPTGSHGQGFASLNQEHADNETTREIIDTAKPDLPTYHHPPDGPGVPDLPTYPLLPSKKGVISAQPKLGSRKVPAQSLGSPVIVPAHS